MTRALLSLLAISIAGCAIQVPLTQQTAASLKGRRLAMTARYPAPFFSGELNPPYLPGSLPALVSVAAVSEEGERIVRQNAIPDPAQAISRQLRDDLEHSYGLRREPQPVAFDEDDPTKLSL